MVTHVLIIYDIMMDVMMKTRSKSFIVSGTGSKDAISRLLVVQSRSFKEQLGCLPNNTNDKWLVHARSWEDDQ